MFSDLKFSHNLAGLLYELPKNIIRCFRGYNLLWHFLAIVFTYVIVTSDFDWHYYLAGQKPFLRAFFSLSLEVGMFLPIVVPLILWAIGVWGKDFKIKVTAFALGQAAFLGLAISSFYKVFTGRIPPPHFLGHGELVDISHGFRFGFLRGGVFEGWPSSHSAVAFAMAFVLWKLYPRNRFVRYGALTYAFYVGIGVSIKIPIHWFSDFVAGAIFGSLIGVVVGNSFEHFKSGVKLR